MANDVAGTPYSVDTTGTITTQKTLVNSFHFVGTAAQAVTVVDSNDRPVWKATCTAEVLQHSTPVGVHLNGIKATITGGGTLYVYV